MCFWTGQDRTGSGTRCSKRKNASAVLTGRCDVVSDWAACSAITTATPSLFSLRAVPTGKPARFNTTRAAQQPDDGDEQRMHERMRSDPAGTGISPGVPSTAVPATGEPDSAPRTPAPGRARRPRPRTGSGTRTTLDYIVQVNYCNIFLYHRHNLVIPCGVRPSPRTRDRRTACPSCPKTQTNSRLARRAVSIVIAPWRALDLGRVGGCVRYSNLAHFAH